MINLILYLFNHLEIYFQIIFIEINFQKEDILAKIVVLIATPTAKRDPIILYRSESEGSFFFLTIKNCLSII